jgi:hypothetical protein
VLQSVMETLGINSEELKWVRNKNLLLKLRQFS